MIYFFPGDFVFWTSVNNHSDIKASLLPVINSNLDNTKNAHNDKWMCNLNTEFFDADKNNDKYFELVTKGIYPALDTMFVELHGRHNNFYTPKSSKVTEIWYNHYVKSCYQEVHNHQNREKSSTFSGLYLLELHEENKTVFVSYNASLFDLGPSNKQLKEASEGDVVLFPSHMMHYVLPCEKIRTSVAFNISCNYEI